MAYRANNSFSSIAIKALNDLHKAKDAVEHRFGSFMQAVRTMMGDEETMGGKIAAIPEWSESAERRKDVAERIMFVIGFDEEWNAKLKGLTGGAKNVEKAARIRAARDVKRVVDCLAAMWVLGDKHGKFAEWSEDMGQWRIPLSWLVSDKVDVMVPSKGPHKDGCTTFTDRNNKAFIVVQGEEGVETIGVSVTPDVLITASSIKPKVLKGADDKKADAAAPETMEAAVDMLGAAISADDYRVSFTGEAADHMALLMSHIVRNDHLYAMLLGERKQYEMEKGKTAAAA